MTVYIVFIVVMATVLRLMTFLIKEVDLTKQRR